tara:strand:+ start:41 stop:583 length:543 start_codon:yes stop_codon:yes gene_type:complete
MTDKINNNNVISELEYLMNPCMYEKWMKKNSSKLAPTDLKKDIKFYKKRIIQLTKDMMKGEHITNSVNKSYNEYMKSCIAYLKFLDTKDILQEEYEGIPSDTVNISEVDEDIDPDNSLINPSYLHKQNKIEDYIDLKKISNVPKNETYLPERKELKLKDPQLKKKGIKKKKGGKKKKNIN